MNKDKGNKEARTVYVSPDQLHEELVRAMERRGWTYQEAFDAFLEYLLLVVSEKIIVVDVFDDTDQDFSEN